MKPRSVKAPSRPKILSALMAFGAIVLAGTLPVIPVDERAAEVRAIKAS
jgi:hypothetical protein